MDTKDTECILEPLSLEQKENGVESSALRNPESSFNRANVIEEKAYPRKLWGWSLQGMTLVVLSVVVVSASITVALVISLLAGLQQIRPHGSVVSESAYCSRLGLDVMENKGGNAVDAAVATSFCMAVARPDLASLAGCGLMLVHEQSSQTSHLYDFICTAPSGAQNPDESTPLTLVGVPGFVRGLDAAHRHFGKIPWPSLFEGVIRLASSGFKPEPALAQAVLLANSTNLIGAENIIDLLKNFNGDIYLPPQGLQETLRNISERGVSYFYLDGGDGSFAQRFMLLLMNSSGANWAPTDLPNYLVRQPKAIQMGFAGFTIEAFPTPSGGPFLLNVLSNLDLMDVVSPLDHAALARNDVSTTATVLHRLLESAKSALLATQGLGDPYDSLIANSVTNAQDKLLSLAARKSFVSTVSDANATSANLSLLSQFNSDIGSTGLLTTDSAGLTVVMSSFLGSPFGTGMIVPRTGVHLNSALRLFSTPDKADLNSIAAGRRPLVPISPIYVSTTHRKCGVRFGLVSPDGFSGTFDATQVLANAALFLRHSGCYPQSTVASHPSYSTHRSDSGASSTLSDYTPAVNVGCINAKAAVDLPRLFLNATTDLQNNTVVSVLYETGYEQQVIDDLAARGHHMGEYVGIWRGRVAAVGWDKHHLIGASDTRGSSWSLLTY
ncbi:unnamed protein product [Dicrocoelium dendriticum]|nr:unnamed protein product [Dicrocoelium dendriticum]